MQIGPYFVSPAELEWSFSPSSGPGGQHANRSHTRATVRFDLGATESIPEHAKAEMLSRLGTRANAGVVAVSVEETRSQATNRDLATERLTQLLAEALRRPRRRKPTRPTAASRQRRLDEKRRRSELKRQRRSDWS